MFDDKTLELLLGETAVQGGAEIHALITANMDIDETAMLRRLYGISITAVEEIITANLALFKVSGHLGTRHDVATSAAAIAGLTGLDLANAIKGAETAAKRRLTTSLTGYGFMAKRENQAGADLVPNAQPAPAPLQVPAVNNDRAALETSVIVTPAQAQKIVESIEAPAPEQIAAREALAAAPGFRDVNVRALDEDANKQHVPANEWPAPKAASTKPFVDSTRGGLFADEPAPSAPVVPAQPSNPVPVVESAPTTAPVASSPAVAPAPVADSVAAEMEAAQPPVRGSDPAHFEGAPKPAGDIPANAVEHAQFMARAAKIVRDVLPKAGIKDFEAGPLVLGWLLKVSGAKKQNKIGKAKFEELLTQLEKAASPEAVVAILKS